MIGWIVSVIAALMVLGLGSIMVPDFWHESPPMAVFVGAVVLAAAYVVATFPLWGTQLS